jgi:putative CocE/NonD family hydrolase
MYRLRDPHVVGERDMGTVDIDLERIIYDFFDFYMKGAGNDFRKQQPHVKYFAMGANEWHEARQWPPKGARTQRLYLGSRDGANSLYGDGLLRDKAPDTEGADTFVYDPMNPVPSLGGNVCCLGDALTPGSFDQRPVEARQDVLVYTSEPLERDLEVTGPIEVILHVSSTAPDTDFTVKLLDVDPDGAAWNLDESIQRARYREGFDREVFMTPGTRYKLALGPLVTSNVFHAGHRIRIEVSSSSFPRFARNMNIEGSSASATTGVVAKNTVHHGPVAGSYIEFTIVPRPK